MTILWRKKLNALLEEFTGVCNEHDIWYALDGGTLLGAVRHGGFIPWQEKLQVMMTPESYMRFERKMGGRVIDNYKYSWYNQNTPCFIESDGEVLNEEPFIKIRIVVPTDRHKYKKYHSIKRIWSDSKMKTNYKEAIHDLLSDKHDSFVFIGPSRLDKRITTRLQVFNTGTTDILFNGLRTKIPADYNKILSTWYGQDFMNTSIPKKYFIYQTPLTKVRAKHVKHG